MGQQQMQSFEQEPPNERGGYKNRVENTDPREQQTPFEEPYYGEAYYGQKLRPQPQQPKPRRPFWLLWLLVPLLLIILVAAPFAWWSSMPHKDMFGPPGISGKVMPDQTQSFKVSGMPTVVIKDPTGSVNIHVGDDHVVTVNSSNGQSDRDGGPVQTTQDGNTITVGVSDGPGSFGGISLDVTVPATANIDIQSRTGSIAIEGVNGQVTANTESGSISMVGGNLSGTSLLQSRSGSINFQGSVDPQGSYQFLSNSGSVNVILPADSSFPIEASSDSGDVHNEFGNNGAPPVVVAKSDSGSVTVIKQ